MDKILEKIGFAIGYIYGALFIAPFPKRRAKWIKRIQNERGEYNE